MKHPVAVTVVYPLDPLGPKIGGSVTFIRGLLRHAPADWALRFIGISSDAAQRPVLRWSTQHLQGRPFEFLPLLHEPREDRRRRIPLSLRFVRQLTPDMLGGGAAVLVHNRPETLLARGVRGHRNVVFVHNDVPAQVGAGSGEVLWSRMPWLYYRFERRAFGLADRVYTVSTSTLDDCRRRYPGTAQKFAFVPTWVDAARFAPSHQPKAALRARLAALGLAIDGLAPWLLYVGRLQPQKAPLRLLEAFALLSRQQSRAQLIVIGDGNLRAAVERQVHALGLAARVHLLGPMPQGALPDYYRAADVLVLGSDFEGMPMCVLEALACGLPVVTTDVGEVARVVRPGLTGEICEARSAHSLCQSLALALDRLDRYDRDACVEAVRPYAPQQVLAPIYAHIGEIARLAGSPARSPA